MQQDIYLHPRLKVDSFRKLDKAIGNALPEAIRVNRRQYDEYYKLLTGSGRATESLLFYKGIKLLLVGRILQ